MMKAAIFYGASKPMKVEEVEDPKTDSDGIIVKVAACGVCHTDLHYMKGTPTFKKPPLILGHEVSGVVQEVGTKVTHLKEGERVLIPAVLTCGICPSCAKGKANICQNMVMVGNHINGGFAELLSVPAKDVIKLNQDIPLEEGAVISDAFTTAYHAVKDRGNVRPGETVAVFGCGGVGLNVVQFASAAGAIVIAVDLNSQKLDLARELGADYAINPNSADLKKEIRMITRGGVDVSFEAIGIPSVMRSAFDSVKPGGKSVILGYSGSDLVIPASRLMFREIEVLGSLGCPPVDYKPVIDLISKGRIKLKPLISHRFSLDQINEAYDLLEQGKTIRSIVVPR